MEAGVIRRCYRHPERETGLSCSECGRPICTECMTVAAVGIRCPEHSGKPQGVQRLTRPVQRAATAATGNYMTRILIGINIAVYLAELAQGAGINGIGGSIYENGVLVARAIDSHGHLVGVAEGQWWRLITSAFLHYGPFHLAINMYSLYFAGSILESYLGRARFLLLYLVSGLAGAAGALVLKPAPTVGASGAIFGILGALLVLERTGRLATGGQIGGLIIVNLIFTFTLSSFISVGGHVGGLIGGFLAMLGLTQFRRQQALGVAAALVIGALSVAVAYYKVHHLGS